jgi:hypothetical protein
VCVCVCVCRALTCTCTGTGMCACSPWQHIFVCTSSLLSSLHAHTPSPTVPPPHHHSSHPPSQQPTGTAPAGSSPSAPQHRCKPKTHHSTYKPTHTLQRVPHNIHHCTVDAARPPSTSSQRRLLTEETAPVKDWCPLLSTMTANTHATCTSTHAAADGLRKRGIILKCYKWCPLLSTMKANTHATCTSTHAAADGLSKGGITPRRHSV